MKSSLVVPAKNVERWTSRRSRDRVVDRSEFVYFGVSMNLKPIQGPVESGVVQVAGR